MRGEIDGQASMLSLLTPEHLVPADHPLRRVKPLADAALAELSPVFDAMYSRVGRPSIPPERLLKASLLMAFFTVRSERQFCEQLHYNFLFRWFLEMNAIDDNFDPTAFTHNRERLLAHDVAGKFFEKIVGQARSAGLMSSEHFTVDGTLIEAWASLKSFRPKDEKPENRDPPDDKGNPTVNFRGEKRSNATHESTTDPEARLARKGSVTTSKLSYSGHALMENRNGLLVDFQIEPASGTAEWDAGLAMVRKHLAPGATVGGDKGYDVRVFVEGLRELGVTPHVAQNTTKRSSRIDDRTTRHPGYGISQRLRKRVEEIFGWAKTVGNFRRTRYKGEERTQLAAYLVGAAYN
ncbi:MAG: IS5 family transposase, partial [Steroidobacteraceae bacterium]